MATGSPAKPWERNRGSSSTPALSSSLRNETTPDEQNENGPSTISDGRIGSTNSPYSRTPYSGSTYGNRYGNSYGNSYGSPYGSSYGSSYGGVGSRYGGMYGSSMYGGSMYGSSMYGSRYGCSLYGDGYGNGIDNPMFDRNGPPGNPNESSILMDMKDVVDGFGHFTRILDYNFDAVNMSFASALRLFDSMSELRRAIYYGLQGLAVFAILRNCFKYLQTILYRLIGKPIPQNTQHLASTTADLFEKQWNGTPSNNTPMVRDIDNLQGRRNSRGLVFILTFFALLLGGPLVFSALYRIIVGRRPRRTSPTGINRPPVESGMNGNPISGTPHNIPNAAGYRPSPIRRY